MCIGYKYTVAEGRIYIITLECYKFTKDTDFDGVMPVYCSNDCKVLKIIDANTGEEKEKISGKAFYCFDYVKGERITGENIYFCKTRSALYAGYLCKDKEGKIQDRKSNVNGFDIFPEIGSMESLRDFVTQYMSSGDVDTLDDIDTLYDEYYFYMEKKYFPEK